MFHIRFTLVLSLVAAMSLFVFSVTPADAQTEASAAKTVVTRFMDALKSADLELLTQSVDLPFMLGGRLLAEPDELKTQLEQMLEKKDMLADLSFEIREVVEFEPVAKGAVRSEVGEFLNRKLQAGDQIVIVDILIPEMKRDRHAYYVAIRGGKVRIVAQRDVPMRKLN